MRQVKLPLDLPVGSKRFLDIKSFMVWGYRMITTIKLPNDKDFRDEIMKDLDRQGWKWASDDSLITYLKDAQFLQLTSKEVFQCTLPIDCNISCDKCNEPYAQQCRAAMVEVVRDIQQPSENKQAVNKADSRVCGFSMPSWLQVNKVCPHCGMSMKLLLNDYYCPGCG